MNKYEYKNINLYLFPIESEASQSKIEDTCNQLAEQGWKLTSTKVLNETNVMLSFKRVKR